jgi:hypothetical protein
MESQQEGVKLKATEATVGGRGSRRVLEPESN